METVGYRETGEEWGIMQPGAWLSVPVSGFLEL